MLAYRGHSSNSKPALTALRTSLESAAEQELRWVGEFVGALMTANHGQSVVFDLGPDLMLLKQPTAQRRRVTSDDNGFADGTNVVPFTDSFGYVNAVANALKSPESRLAMTAVSRWLRPGLAILISEVALSVELLRRRHCLLAIAADQTIRSAAESVLIHLLDRALAGEFDLHLNSTISNWVTENLLSGIGTIGSDSGATALVDRFEELATMQEDAPLPTDITYAAIVALGDLLASNELSRPVADKVLNCLCGYVGREKSSKTSDRVAMYSIGMSTVIDLTRNRDDVAEALSRRAEGDDDRATELLMNRIYRQIADPPTSPTTIDSVLHELQQGG